MIVISARKPIFISAVKGYFENNHFLHAQEHCMEEIQCQIAAISLAV